MYNESVVKLESNSTYVHTYMSNKAGLFWSNSHVSYVEK